MWKTSNKKVAMRGTLEARTLCSTVFGKDKDDLFKLPIHNIQLSLSD